MDSVPGSPGGSRPHSSEGEELPEVVDSGQASIDRAVEILRAGGLVAMPTETVYGLAADASSPAAVRRIYEAKGRPADHPLIVHIGANAELGRWARAVPEEAERLAEAFWPGPLTLVLKRSPSTPSVVSGGLDTVALRMPAHPVARRILDQFGGGLAAPSANRFGRVSPTTAGDVATDLGDRIDLIVDGGPCLIGVESTIVEIEAVEGEAESPVAVRVLRPGGITVEALEEELDLPVQAEASGPARAPGMLASHYAPRTPLRIHDEVDVSGEVELLVSSGARVGVIGLEEIPECGAEVHWNAGGDPDLFARSLYGWLREADALSLDYLVAALPPSEGVGMAIRDRLVRASGR